MFRKNKIVGWFYLGHRVIENDGLFIRLENGDVYAWDVNGKLI
jgi:hypothetical protein